MPCSHVFLCTCSMLRPHVFPCACTDLPHDASSCFFVLAQIQDSLSCLSFRSFHATSSCLSLCSRRLAPYPFLMFFLVRWYTGWTLQKPHACMLVLGGSKQFLGNRTTLFLNHCRVQASKCQKPSYINESTSSQRPCSLFPTIAPDSCPNLVSPRCSVTSDTNVECEVTSCLSR